MEDKKLNTKESNDKLAAFLDAKGRSKAAQAAYSSEQQQQAASLFELTRTAYIRSRVYLTYRDKFYTVKIEKPSGADRLSREADNVENMFAAVGAEKAVSAQGTIYRVTKH